MDSVTAREYIDGLHKRGVKAFLGKGRDFWLVSERIGLERYPQTCCDAPSWRETRRRSGGQRGRHDSTAIAVFGRDTERAYRGMESTDVCVKSWSDVTNSPSSSSKLKMTSVVVAAAVITDNATTNNKVALLT